MSQGVGPRLPATCSLPYSGEGRRLRPFWPQGHESVSMQAKPWSLNVGKTQLLVATSWLGAGDGMCFRDVLDATKQDGDLMPWGASLMQAPDLTRKLHSLLLGILCTCTASSADAGLDTAGCRHTSKTSASNICNARSCTWESQRNCHEVTDQAWKRLTIMLSHRARSACMCVACCAPTCS